MGVVAAVAPLTSCESSRIGSGANAVNTHTVYRFQTRKARTCNACNNHSRYKIFMTAQAADQNRAHPGCNCKIVEQTITQTYMDKITLHEKNGVVELRTAFGYR